MDLCQAACITDQGRADVGSALDVDSVGPKSNAKLSSWLAGGAEGKLVYADAKGFVVMQAEPMGKDGTRCAAFQYCPKMQSFALVRMPVQSSR